MIIRNIIGFVIILTVCPYLCAGHGRMMDPPARNSMWRLGFNNPVNYNDNELYCGGRMVQWIRNKGKCGICGDPYHGKRPHEAGGKFANGVIGKSYHEGAIIPVVVHLTANHQGWFEFKICPVNDPKTKVTQKCLDKHVLQRADGKGTTFPIPQGKYNAFFNFSVKLPDGLTCKQCVIQWKYRTGNTWDKDDRSGVFCLGCGPQEEFYNCADVEILPKGEKSKWIKETIPTTTTVSTITSLPTPKHITIPTKKNTTPYQKPKTTSKYKPTTTTTSKPTKLIRYKEKLRKFEKDTTSSETYLVNPKLLDSERRDWRASASPKTLSRWVKTKSQNHQKSVSPFKKPEKRTPFKKPKTSTPFKKLRKTAPITKPRKTTAFANAKKTTPSLKPRKPTSFSKPKKTTLPTWLMNTRRIQERKRKLVEKRQQYLRRQELIRKQKAYRRKQEIKRKRIEQTRTTKRMISTPASKSTRPTTTTTTRTTIIRRPVSTPKPTKRFLANTKYTPCTKHAHSSNSMIASSDLHDMPPPISIRGRHSRPATPAPTTAGHVYVTRKPSFSQYDYVPKIRPRVTDAHYDVEYPEHPVVETDQTLDSPVHRHNLPFQSNSPFANPGRPHTNPLINYWWNQYQRPIVNLWNNVRPVLKCHATITLGGGMDEWCTANCNANFCPGGMCICTPQSSVYPTYAVYPRESQSWMNSYTPTVHLDTPRPLSVQNPYIVHRRHQQQLQAYKNHEIRQQQQHFSNIYSGHNTIKRKEQEENSAEKLIKKYAPTIESNTTPASTSIIKKRSTSKVEEITTEAPQKFTPTSMASAQSISSALSGSQSKTDKVTFSKTSPKPMSITSKIPHRATTSKAQSFFWPLLRSFKASIQSSRGSKRTSTAWLINTERTRESVSKSKPTKQTLIPEKGYKASPSSEIEVTKVQKRAKRLKSRNQFRNKNLKCHAVGRYKGLVRFDNWCNRNCKLTICPLLICQCEHY